jgi:transcription antitermination protein NusB
MTMTTTNPNSLSRDLAVQFLYQCESHKLFYFSPEDFESFCGSFNVAAAQRDYLLPLVRGTLSSINDLDEIISKHSKNWKITRMASTDRVVLRLATFEILEKMAPDKVILNEAIELAKRYGTEHSGSFVNGILDAILAGQRT